jgi:phosphoribosylamine--glycine ligase
MNFLIVGSGGREHAIAKVLKSSQNVSQIFALPGSDGIAALAQISFIPITDHFAICEFALQKKIDCVIIGPEVPLAEGLSDALRKKDLKVFGPSQQAAQLEASKIISKNFMLSAKIPTARSWKVASVSEVETFAKQTNAPYVLKADGLAAGKGVYICKNLEELISAAKDLFEKKVLGSAGDAALLEEFTAGYELSYLILTNGQDYEPLLLAQDHKRLKDGDQGPNTGGMGTVAPMHISKELDERIHREIFAPVMLELQKQKLFYRGVLFVGLMITSNGPSVLEFNVRFGDPETQVILPLLDGDWAEVFMTVANGEIPRLKWNQNFATCIVLAAENYPEQPKQNVVIDGLCQSQNTNSSYLLHAGTKRKGPEESAQWVTQGGRVLNVVGIGHDLAESRKLAYELAHKIQWPQMQFRKDIGIKQN